MAVFDSSVLLLAIDPSAKAPIDPATNLPLKDAAKRIENLFNLLIDIDETIVIPAPVLCEILVHADEASQNYLTYLRNMGDFRIAPFGERAAILAASSMREAIRRGGHRVDSTNPNTAKAKIKFDRQIVAIAKIEKEKAIYSDDNDIHKLAERIGINSYRTSDILLSP